MPLYCSNELIQVHGPATQLEFLLDDSDDTLVEVEGYI